ncbi:MAG: HDIG domain-containing protein [ANME-2 cluster archaeon]|nr:HDIG domain-containing protein [ANME-2 cluster archaeon]
MIPDKYRALELLEIAGCSDKVIKHCLTVAEYSRECAKKVEKNGHPIDVELVFIGALLHDIGRSITHDINHAVEGACLGREYGLNPSIIRIIETHIGAGIAETEARSQGLPQRNYFPSTIEEKIVAHADNLVDDIRIISISEKVDKLREKGMRENIVERIVELYFYVDEMMR